MSGGSAQSGSALQTFVEALSAKYNVRTPPSSTKISRAMPRIIVDGNSPEAAVLTARGASTGTTTTTTTTTTGTTNSRTPMRGGESDASFEGTPGGAHHQGHNTTLFSSCADDSLIDARTRELDMVSKIKEFQKREAVMASLSQRTQQQVDELQARLAGLVKDNAELKHLVRASIQKAFITPMTSDEHAHFKELAPVNVDWADWIRLCLHDKVLEYNHNVSQLHMVNQAHARLQHESEEQRSLLQSDVDALRDRLRMYEERTNALEAQLVETSSTLDTCRYKAREYDTVQRSARDLEGEKGGLDVKVRVLSEELSATKEELQRDKMTLQHLQVEHKWLQKDSATNLQRVKELEESLSRAKADIRDANERRDKAIEQLHADKEHARQQYDATLAKEVSRLEAHAAEDLERVRASGRDLVDRETRALREARDAAIAEMERLRRELVELRESSEGSRTEHRNVEESLQTRCFDLQAQVRTRSAELTRVEGLLAASDEANSKLRLHSDCQERKLQTLKSEFYEMRLAYEQKISERECVITTLENKLKIWNNAGPTMDGGAAAKGYFQSEVMGALKGRCTELQIENESLNTKLGVMADDLRRLAAYQTEVAQMKELLISLKSEKKKHASKKKEPVLVTTQVSPPSPPQPINDNHHQQQEAQDIIIYEPSW
eukprot:PhM_4_TR15089/c0_g1_i1/m.16876/K16538/PIBF1, CEP90; progesterone-induced-blocking factor 1